MIILQPRNLEWLTVVQVTVAAIGTLLERPTVAPVRGFLLLLRDDYLVIMRILKGIDEGRSFLNRRISNDDHSAGLDSLERLEEVFGTGATPSTAVARILADVREYGDEGVLYYSRIFDPIYSDSFEVRSLSIQEAESGIPRGLRSAIDVASARIRAFATHALPSSWFDETEGFGINIIPINRIGIYAPGGSASYPSTVLMTSITAQVAGVSEVILCTPQVTPAVMYAAALGGVTRVFQIGGAQAIAAMAFGTNSVPKVDKICGPGNIFVATAKRQLYGTVDIDGIYGPTETLIIADGSANYRFCAADLLAQAEHDQMAVPILITTLESFADLVTHEIDKQLAVMDRREIAQASIEKNGAVVIVKDLDEAMELANLFAPEHISLMTTESPRLVSQVRYAGGVFVGEYSPEVIGDYVAGPSHTMPTGGSSRFNSYLGVHHFLRFMPTVDLHETSFSNLAESAKTLAKAEGLMGHARAIEIRQEQLNARRNGDNAET
jgi:histidinol dehydrogenase